MWASTLHNRGITLMLRSIQKVVCGMHGGGDAAGGPHASHVHSLIRSLWPLR